MKTPTKSYALKYRVSAVKEPFVSSDVMSVKHGRLLSYPLQNTEEQTVLASRAVVTFCWLWVGDASVHVRVCVCVSEWGSKRKGSATSYGHLQSLSSPPPLPTHHLHHQKKLTHFRRGSTQWLFAFKNCPFLRRPLDAAAGVCACVMIRSEGCWEEGRDVTSPPHTASSAHIRSPPFISVSILPAFYSAAVRVCVCVSQ